MPDQGPLHSDLLPAPFSDRALVGIDAQKRDPQSLLRDLQRFLPIRSAFSTRGSAEKLGRLLRFGHRQFPHHQPRRFSGSQGIGVYHVGPLPASAACGRRGSESGRLSRVMLSTPGDGPRPQRIALRK